MKHLLTIFSLCILGLTGCGNGNSGSNNSNSSAADTTPGETVEAFAYAMQAGDTDKLKALCPDFEANLSADEIQALAATLASNARANGGIASITIDKEDVDGDTATVTATLTNGNGLSGTETFDLNKTDGKWLIDMTDSFDQLPQDEPEGAATE
ncbi:MAG: DUF4878 domain-containing protein [Phycisphaeraceae bacterium]|nr:DUF4878 domain-containing protein [Phycisphaeraceae bacterium]